MMKRIGLIIAVLACALYGCTDAKPQEEPHDELQQYAYDEIRVMSFNVKVDATGADGGPTSWISRREACAEMMMDIYPTFIGLQEATYTDQWLWLKDRLKDNYDGFGVNRDTGEEGGNGEVMGILYNRNQVEKLAGGTFWLSETPGQVSTGWGARYPRSATWGIFLHKKTNKSFLYINTHLDHQQAMARINGMAVIKERFAMYNSSGMMQILTADFNCTSDNAAFAHINDVMKNARGAAPADKTDSHVTFNGWSADGGSIIDHIYVSDAVTVLDYHTVCEPYGDCAFLSDHYPIVSTIRITNNK